MAAPRAWMPYFHAAFSFGAVLGAGSVALAAWQGVGLVQPPVLAALAAALAEGAATDWPVLLLVDCRGHRRRSGRWR